MSESFERLDGDLRELVRREGRAPDLPDERVRRARDRLETRLFVGVGLAVGATVAGATATAATTATTTVGAAATGLKALPLAKLAAVALLAFASGIATGWVAAKRSPDARSTAASPAMASATPSAVPIPAESAGLGIDVGVLPAAPLSAAPTATPPRANAAASPKGASPEGASVDTSPTERALLDQTRRAVQEGNGAQALELVRRHEHDHPRGSLVEEREVLRVNALVSLGRIDEAKSRAVAFRKRFPTSPFLTALDSQLRDRYTPMGFATFDEWIEHHASKERA